MIGPAVIAQKLPGEHHVVGRHRHAVGEMRRGIESEGDVVAGVVGFDIAREKTIERERLVVAARHQAFHHIAADRLYRQPHDDEWIEAVECSKHAFHQPTAFRGVGIDIRHGGEVLGHSRRAVHGDGVSRICLLLRQRHRTGERCAKSDPQGVTGRGGQHGCIRYQMELAATGHMTPIRYT